MKDGVHPSGYTIKRKQTNADRIRSMTDEQLAQFLYGTDHYVNDGECIIRIGTTRLQDSKEDILDWLQSEVDPIYAEWKQHLLNRFEGGDSR